MGIFMRSSSVRAAELAPAQSGSAALSWSRLLFAAGLLGAMLLAAVFTSDDRPIHTVMLHSFELVLGAVIGILTGEAAHAAT